MDEQAGQQEHQRTASVPPIPHIAPPKYPHQKWELTRARGYKTGPTSLKLPLPAEGQRKDAGCRGSVIDILLQVCVCMCVCDTQNGLQRLPSAHKEAGRRPWTGGALLSLNSLHPLHSSQRQSQTRPVFCWSVVGKGCPHTTAYWARGYQIAGRGRRGGAQVKLPFSVFLYSLFTWGMAWMAKV